MKCIIQLGFSALNVRSGVALKRYLSKGFLWYGLASGVCWPYTRLTAAPAKRDSDIELEETKGGIVQSKHAAQHVSSKPFREQHVYIDWYSQLCVLTWGLNLHQPCHARLDYELGLEA